MYLVTGDRWYLITPWSSAELMALTPCTCSQHCAMLLWLYCIAKLSEACASLRMISSFHRWVESEERCERYYRLRGTWAACGPLWDSWQVDRSPTRERQFHGPHCLHWLLLWSQESRAWDSPKPTTESRSSWAEEVIIIIIIIMTVIMLHIIIITVFIIASWPYKPGVPCVFTAALPFYWLRALILIRLRECQKFRKNHPSNEIIKVIYANQLCCQLIKTGVPPLESEEVHLFS